MLIHPWDAARPGEAEEWLGTTAMFGQLVVNNADSGQAPLVIPTHAVLDQQTLLVHLARPNPVWRHIQAAPRVRFTVVGDYAYIPSTWRARAGGPDEDGVPTSYYSTVQFVCDAHIIDDPQAKVALLDLQLRHLQPEGGHAPIGVGLPPYGRMLSGIRGLRLDIIEQTAKFKYDDHNPVDHRRRVIAQLNQRGLQHDRGAAGQQSRRLAERRTLARMTHHEGIVTVLSASYRVT
jgi:transcriptional regulator